MIEKFIILLLFMGLWSMLYIAIDQAYSPLYSWTGTNMTDSNFTGTLSLINILFTWWPGAILFSYVLYSINRARKESEVRL